MANVYRRDARVRACTDATGCRENINATSSITLHKQWVKREGFTARSERASERAWHAAACLIFNARNDFQARRLPSFLRSFARLPRRGGKSLKRTTVQNGRRDFHLCASSRAHARERETTECLFFHRRVDIPFRKNQNLGRGRRSHRNHFAEELCPLKIPRVTCTSLILFLLLLPSPLRPPLRS